MTTTPIETPRMILRSTREMDGGFCLSLWLDDEMGRYLADRRVRWPTRPS